jgi:septal ring-binding cell division protein DamX
VQEAPEQAERKLDTNCPTCGAPAERGQLVCLECGSRIALAYKRPPSWKLPIAIIVVVGALAITGAVLAYEAVDDDAKDEVAATPLKPKQTSDPRPQTSGEKAKAKAKPTPKPRPAATAGGLTPKGKLYTWPRDLKAFTVILLSSEDRASATAVANSVADANDAKTGVIRSNDFVTLPKGFFVVFGGSYKTRARADRAAARLGAKYQGAFAQLVRR